MSKRYFLITGNDLKLLLDKFSELCKEKVYEKIPYEVFRDLVKMTMWDNIFIKSEYECEDIYGITKCKFIFEIDNKTHIFTLDSDFGKFLRDYLLKKDLNITETNMAADYDTDYETSNNCLNDYYGSDVLSSKADVVNYDGTVSVLEDLKANSAEATNAIQELADKLKETRCELNLDKKENKDMMKGFNFEFGPLNSHLAKMSIYGFAVKNKNGVYVSYNKETAELIDVDIFQFDGSKFLYRMPVAIKDIVVGDVVIHQNIPMFVTEIPAHGKTLFVIDPCNGERKEIMLTRSPFGFNFATKIVNFLDGMMNGVAPSADNPFGNMWMLALMDGDNKDMSKMLPFMFMNQNGMNMDPMMMMLMMGDNKDMGDMLPLMMMMNMNKPAPVEHHCNGNCHRTDGHHE